jgi:hypothetical protein
VTDFFDLGDTAKLFDRTGWRFLIWTTILGAIFLGLFFYILWIKPSNLPNDVRLSGRIRFCMCEKGAPWIALESWELYYFRTSTDIDRTNDYLCRYLKPGDSLFKRSGSDTLYVIRGPVIKRWLVHHQ